MEPQEDEVSKKGPMRKGRRKIEIKYIPDKSRRHITFSKRKAGIMKKSYELATLTGTQVLLLVASETGHVYTFATPRLQPLITEPEGKNLIQTCLNSSDGEQLVPPEEVPHDMIPLSQPPLSKSSSGQSANSIHMASYTGIKREREAMPEQMPHKRRAKLEKLPPEMDLPPGYLPSNLPMGSSLPFPSLPPHMFPRQVPSNYPPVSPHVHAPPPYGYPPQPQGYMTRSVHGMQLQHHQGPEPHLLDSEQI